MVRLRREPVSCWFGVACARSCGRLSRCFHRGESLARQEVQTGGTCAPALLGSEGRRTFSGRERWQSFRAEIDCRPNLRCSRGSMRKVHSGAWTINTHPGFGVEETSSVRVVGRPALFHTNRAGLFSVRGAAFNKQNCIILAKNSEISDCPCQLSA